MELQYNLVRSVTTLGHWHPCTFHLQVKCGILPLVLRWYCVPTKLSCNVHPVHSTVAAGDGREDDGGHSLHVTGEGCLQLSVLTALDACSLAVPRGGDVLGGPASEGHREVCSFNAADCLVSWRL